MEPNQSATQENGYSDSDLDGYLVVPGHQRDLAAVATTPRPRRLWPPSLDHVCLSVMCFGLVLFCKYLSFDRVQPNHPAHFYF